MSGATMPWFRALRYGFGRLRAHPGLVALLWLVNLLAALPAALVLTASLDRAIGSSLADEGMREGFDMEWYGVWEAGARGIEKTFRPTVQGAGAFLDNLEGWATGKPTAAFAGLTALAAPYALLWLLLAGGVIERFADPRGTHSATRLWGAGARYFFRLVRLALLSGLLYLGVYALHRWLYGRLADWTREVTVERTALLASLAVVALTALLLVLVHMAATFAKVATITEDRRSMLLALWRGLRFVAAHPLRVLGLFLVPALASGLLLALYHGLGPGVGQGTWPAVAFAFLVGQILLAARLALRLALVGAAVALYGAAEGPRREAA